MKFSKFMLFALFSTSFADDDEDGEGPVAKIGKRCKVTTPTKWGGKDIIEICPENYPDNTKLAPKRIWYIFAYDDTKVAKGLASMKTDSDASVNAANDLTKRDKQVGVGRLDCTDRKDWCKSLGFDMDKMPNLNVITGKNKGHYNYMPTVFQFSVEQWRKHLKTTKDYWKEPKAKCAQGIFEGTKVTSMCPKNFPDAKDRTTLVFLYNKDIATKVPDFKNTVVSLYHALEGPEQKRDKRIESIAKKHGFEANLGPSGVPGFEALVDIGAVCCDCDDKNPPLCEKFDKLWSAEQGWAPLLMMNGIPQDEIESFSKVEPTLKDLSGLVLSSLGYIAGREHEEL